jgi:monoterpene epsilon-lactone hydrolase
MIPSYVAMALFATVPLAVATDFAQTVTDDRSEFSQLEATQNAANSKPGARSLPARIIPVLDTVSPQLQSTIASTYHLPPGTRIQNPRVSGRNWWLGWPQ